MYPQVISPEGCFGYGRGGPSFLLSFMSICPPDFISFDTDRDAVNEVSLKLQCSPSPQEMKNRIYLHTQKRHCTVRMPKLVSDTLASECRPRCMVCSSTSFLAAPNILEDIHLVRISLKHPSLMAITMVHASGDICEWRLSVDVLSSCRQCISAAQPCPKEVLDLLLADTLPDPPHKLTRCSKYISFCTLGRENDVLPNCWKSLSSKWNSRSASASTKAEFGRAFHSRSASPHPLQCFSTCIPTSLSTAEPNLSFGLDWVLFFQAKLEETWNQLRQA